MSGWIKQGRLPVTCAYAALYLICCIMLATPVTVALAQDIPSSAGMSVRRACQSCHDEVVYGKAFVQSAHGNNSCTSCHTGVWNLSEHESGATRPEKVNCANCHRDIALKFKKDVHAVKQNFECQDCHSNIHEIKKNKMDIKMAVAENCTRCHSAADYALMGHGRAVAAGNPDSATCTDCHGLHNTPYYNLSQERDVAAARENYTRRCRACHADAKMAKRNNFSTKTVSGFDETYHGKVINIGFPQRVAGCADCHLGHNTLPKIDTRSSRHPDNLYNTCRTCHKGMHKRFVSFNPHPDPHDAKKDPGLYWTNVFMICLLAGTFLFFWIHSLLWWRRAFLDKCKQTKAGYWDQHVIPECRVEMQIQRFSIIERAMHVILVISFFTLVMTGFSLKYNDTAWAKVMVNLWGGAYRAGLFHRIAALILCGQFLYTLWLSLKFLFPKRQFKGSLSRLFSPDSLFPNLKDLRDIKGMFLWFFHKGDMPKLDRWTYWEKFDFLAVFWGMTAIGGLGFVLWFPELFSYVLPGRLINLAAVIHSEEAFLAAVFIFTVHFFNNHLVPNKFPLEPNIFTGRYRLAAMQEERPLEFERLVAEGRLDDLKREGPGIGAQLFASVFGLGSLILGLFLLFLILWAAIFY
ncbi:MAG: hypothetical protein CSYNP_02712 [Syntrophus sp. SKADARSKE-3]|nr:hypothetical protein [Syntrophus sp. SKADARSKE-3]